MELSAVGERVFAAEALLKRRIRKVPAAAAAVAAAALSPSAFLRLATVHRLHGYSTWEPEENILDARLLAAFEEREREMELYGPKKRGPKPKTFLLKAQAKAKAKTYEFRSDSARGIRIPYPGRSPQDLASTSRAREGLRNMGLSPPGSSSSTCRVEPPRDREREREQDRERVASRAEEKPCSPGDSSKKRGPRPRKEPLDPSQRPLGEPGDGLGDYLKGRKLDDTPTGAGKFPAGHSVIQLARRQDSDPAQCGVASPSPTDAAGKLAVDTFPARVIKHRATFLEVKGQGTLDPGGPRVRPGSGAPGSVGGLYRDMGAQGGRPSLIARIPVARILGDPEEESWSPSLTNLEKVVVTDVTSNFLTVTIKESNTDQGFFKEKR
ncbi:Chromobox protein-8 [Galemys pyrenaicus]|uniref:Chromobox protein-8 n=1 Tax=Galemys pyrenaicus TaxID=202257 RepID=A0A8J5ZMM6_GALPY|nr:Chromobox protein-8 [Galemys pyrenaicus]